MTEERLARDRAIVAEVSRRKARPYLSGLFPEQLAVVKDPSPVIAAHPGRRGGKTHTMMAWLFQGMQDTVGTTSAYLALTRGSAKRIMWRDMKESNARHRLGFGFGEVELSVTDPLTGSCILLGGADDAEAIERLRGGKYYRAGIDECGSFAHNILRSLIVDILRPALGDLRGQLLLTGTPGRVCHGFFFDVCTDKSLGWSVHHWTVLNNPYFREPAAYLAEERKLNHWTEDHPTYQREWLGRWVQASDSLVYQYNRGRNGVSDGPKDKEGLKYVLGVDFGFKDSTAWSVWCYYDSRPETWCLESFKQAGMTPGQVAEKTAQLMERYDFDRIVGDAGGLGKGYVEEAKLRFGIPFVVAKKNDKRGYIELMNGDMQAGLLRIVTHMNEELIGEWSTIPWKDANREEEAPAFDNHLADAALYAWRHCRAWNHEPPAKGPAKGSAAWWKEQEAAVWEHDDPKPQDHDMAWAETDD